MDPENLVIDNDFTTEISTNDLEQFLSINADTEGLKTELAELKKLAFFPNFTEIGKWST